MSLVNYSTREITCKVVYYGPGRSGKTTNLQHIHAAAAGAAPQQHGLARHRHRPHPLLRLPAPRAGPHLRLQRALPALHRARARSTTTPPASWCSRAPTGWSSWPTAGPTGRRRTWRASATCRQNLLEQGVDPRALPLCLQFNKRDLPDAVPRAEMERALNYRGLRCLRRQRHAGRGRLRDAARASASWCSRSLARRFQRAGEPVG